MSSELRTLVDAYIEDHSRLSTPVALFAHAHESESEARLATARAQLIPLSAPATGEQYAFEVNLDACTGCKACVAACHSLNGLDEGEAWRDVGLLVGGDPGLPYQQTITSACHHCADPGCLNGCPVLAYEKDPVSGIVRHLDDQCIGCQYCVLKCPYDVPKYNPRLGIVRKCDMCHQRLAVGEAPACAQACPTHAIRIVRVPVGADETGRPSCPGEHFLAAAPDASLTRPSTRYVSKRPIPAGARPADLAAPRPQPGHTPLALMLALTQAGYGLLLGGALAGEGEHLSWTVPTGLGLVALGLACSAAHLGQPLRMWRVFLNLRRSWLSREAVILGASFGLLVGATAARLLALPLPGLELAELLGLALGLAGVFCSAMIYVDTGRHFWRPAPVFLRMGGTLAVFAALPLSPGLGAALLLAKLAGEALVLRGLSAAPGRLSASARLHAGPLLPLVLSRLALALVAAGLLCAGLLPPALALLLLGELLERSLFFRAVDASAMPGNPAAPATAAH